jgi:hypothetical protein
VWKRDIGPRPTVDGTYNQKRTFIGPVLLHTGAASGRLGSAYVLDMSALLDESGAIFGVMGRDLLSGGPEQAWKGRLVVRAGGGGGDEQELWRLRSGGRRAELEAAIDRALNLAGGGTLCLRPSADDALSDVPTCLGVLRGWVDRGVELLHDPAAFLTERMRRHAADHIRRSTEAFAAFDHGHAVRGVVVGDEPELDAVWGEVRRVARECCWSLVPATRP